MNKPSWANEVTEVSREEALALAAMGVDVYFDWSYHSPTCPMRKALRPAPPSAGWDYTECRRSLCDKYWENLLLSYLEDGKDRVFFFHLPKGTSE
jgi:hypothetical protein